MKTLIPILILALCGCTGSVHKVGCIGGYTVYTVKLPSAAGPSINVALLQGEDTNAAPIVLGTAAGNGVSTTVLQAGGIIGAAAVLKPVETHNSSTVTGTSSPEPQGPPPPVYGPPLPPHMKQGGWGNNK